MTRGQRALPSTDSERPPVLRRVLFVLSFCLLGGCNPTDEINPQPLPLDPSVGEIDLSGYEVTFSEEFDARLDISPRGCDTRWIAHTPWSGDFGDAKFEDPFGDFPFRTEDGILRIEARQDAYDGTWSSGLLSSGNACGTGFAQKFGYFEMRAKLPAGEGLWPAFWLISWKPVEPGGERWRSSELDVIEHYGHEPGKFESVIHVDAVRPGGRKTIIKKSHTVPEGSLYDQYNTFGVSIEDDFTIFYLNRREIWRRATFDESKEPMLILLNLAMGSGHPIDETPNPSRMYVDYVKVWQMK